jgi:predicted HTH domain antitoxin
MARIGIPEDDLSPATLLAIQDYLDDQISVGKAAERLNLSRFELTDLFQRFGIPLRLGPASIEEARTEIAAARDLQ